MSSTGVERVKAAPTMAASVTVNWTASAGFVPKNRNVANTLSSPPANSGGLPVNSTADMAGRVKCQKPAHAAAPNVCKERTTSSTAARHA